MTYRFHHSLSPPALALLLLLTGCGAADGTDLDLGTTGRLDDGIIPVIPIECTGPGTTTLYRVTALHIPTSDEASDGSVAVGHNVDGVGTVCNVPDHAGGVDNALFDLAEALPSLGSEPPVDLQAELDNALNCPVDAPASQCSRLDLVVSVETTGVGCAVVSVLDGDGATLAAPFVASVDANGGLRGQVAALALAIPYQTPTGPVSINLAVSNVILTANQSATALTDIVLGGSLERAAFEQTIMDLLPFLGSGITFSSIAPILASLYDVQVGGVCAALSVGLTGAANVVETP